MTAAAVPFKKKGIPAELRGLHQYFVHREKIPHSAIDGRPRSGVQGSPEDLARMVDFDTAVRAVESGRWSGLGIGLTAQDNILCIDIDKCRNPETGELSPLARKVLDLVGATYVEISFSGTGLHVFCIYRGTTDVFKTEGLEVYRGRQFIALTGDLLPGAVDHLAEISDEAVDRLRRYVDRKKASKRKQTRHSESPVKENFPQGSDNGKARDKASEHARRYCLGALDRAVDDVRGAVEGGRNDTLNKAAHGLAQLVATGGINEATIIGALTTAAESIGLAPGEIRTTIASGMRAGAADPRVIPPPRGSRSAQNSAPVGDAVDWREQAIKKDDRLLDCRENVYLVAKHHPQMVGVIAADEFSRKIVKQSPPPWESEAGFTPGTEWGEDDDLRFGLWLAQDVGLLVRSAEVLSSAVGWAARENRFHPVRDYLDGLQWDGQSRCASWLTDYLGVRSSPYSKLSGKLFLIGMVARIYQPGCIMRAMPILEGAQFRGKSTAARILAGEWFGDTPLDLKHKDAYQLIQGRWLYEIAELDSFNRAETTGTKAFVSSPEDRFRAPYDRSPRDWPRQTVFIGTTNQTEYFKDQTGNTRYWPWPVEEVSQIDLDKLAANRDQLFAEAAHLYRAGHRWHPTRDEQLTLFEPQQQDREIADPWQSLIAKWLTKNNNQNRFTVTDILIDCLKIEAGKVDSSRQMSTRVGIAMKRLGWTKRRESDGDREYYYMRPDVTAAADDGGQSVDL